MHPSELQRHALGLLIACVVLSACTASHGRDDDAGTTTRPDAASPFDAPDARDSIDARSPIDAARTPDVGASDAAAVDAARADARDAPGRDTACELRSWFQDLDHDGYGDPATETLRCEAEPGEVREGRDCDDTSFAVSPLNLDVCNGIDDDCNGIVDGEVARLRCGWAPHTEAVDCVDAVCRSTVCSTGWVDCNGSFADGCEVAPVGDAWNCGACGTMCIGTELCSNGRCRSVPEHRWALRIFGDNGDEVTDMVLDPVSGDLVIAGVSWSSTMTIGPFDLPGLGGGDVFVARISPAGVVRWAIREGGASDESAGSVALDAGGNIYIGVTAHGPARTVGGLLPAGVDAYVASYSPDGARRWVTAISGADYESSASVAVSAGVVVTSGATRSSALNGVPAIGPGDGFVVRLSTAGAILSTQRFGATRFVSFLEMAPLGDGVVLATGIQGVASFGPFTLDAVGTDAALVALDAGGAVRWATSMGGAASDELEALALGGDDRVYAGGRFDEGGIVGTDVLAGTRVGVIASIGTDGLGPRGTTACDGVPIPRMLAYDRGALLTASVLEGRAPATCFGETFGASFGPAYGTLLTRVDATGAGWAVRIGQGDGSTIPEAVVVDGAGTGYLSMDYDGELTLGGMRLPRASVSGDSVIWAFGL